MLADDNKEGMDCDDRINDVKCIALKSHQFRQCSTCLGHDLR